MLSFVAEIDGGEIKMNMNGMGGGYTIPVYVFLEDRRPQMERAIQFAEEEKRKRVGN
jgi:hypothetical protein